MGRRSRIPGELVPSTVDPDLTLDVPFRANGIGQLDPVILGQSPYERYRGVDATTSAWPAWDYGADLTVAGSGDPTVNQGSPLFGVDDDSILYNIGKYHEHANDPTSTEDLWVEALICPGASGTQRGICGDYDTNGWFLSVSNTNKPQLYFRDSSEGAANYINADANLPEGVWGFVTVVLHRSGSGRIWVNGVVGATVGGVSAAVDISSSSSFRIGTIPTALAAFNGSVGYVGIWRSDSWLSTHVQDDLVAERFAQLSGTCPELSLGTTVPTVATRSSTAYIQKFVSGVPELHQVGISWPRISQRKDAAGTIHTGYLPEAAVTNYLPESTDFSSWDNGGTAVITANDTTSPDPKLSADEITVGTAGGELSDSAVDAGATATDNYAPSIWLRRDTGETGNLRIQNYTATANGEWNVDISNLPELTWVRITREVVADYGSVLTEFTVPAGKDVGLKLIAASGTVKVWAWGAQSESRNEDMFTSTILSEGTATARSADNLRYKGDDGNLGGVGSELKGTVTMDVLLPDISTAGNDAYLFSLSDGALPSHNHQMNYVAASARIDSNVFTDGAIAGAIDILDGVQRRAGLAWDTNDQEQTLNGVADGTPDTSVTPVNDLDQIDIGEDYNQANQFNGLISNLKIYKVRK